MDGKEQEALFEKVKAHFLTWNASQCSGYVHGIVDESRVSEPLDCYMGNYDAYSKGYIDGFIDARGGDVVTEEWFKAVFDRGIAIDFKWWAE